MSSAIQRVKITKFISLLIEESFIEKSLATVILFKILPTFKNSTFAFFFMLITVKRIML